MALTDKIAFHPKVVPELKTVVPNKMKLFSRLADAIQNYSVLVPGAVHSAKHSIYQGLTNAPFHGLPPESALTFGERLIEVNGSSL